ncbi:hypothetical protein PV327_007195 [Microctonus hyperodae]|uniref:OTU domain-containing protein n=1 Tax=Microctonus hyperodae TaxID=165561 RepID=A0AA39F5Y7_MICHY|nr:hypothetical protein PV327_007195 [Microctonus hyperodae]
MDNSRRKSHRTMEPADEWLNNEGYYRKTSPKDPTCLFRAVSEQIYLTQYYHIKVRKECVEFMRDNKELFEKELAVPVENYLKQMLCFTEWGGINEIKAMSRLYKCDFIIFDCQKMVKKNVTNNGFDKLIYLCHIMPQQYETIYEKNFIKTAAYCQSIVYQTLYKNVFKMSDIDDTIQNMLHDRSGNIKHNKFFLKGNITSRERLTSELFNKIDNDSESIDDKSKAVTPFPYRVAKSLDPNIYRNTDFDTWHELKREARGGIWIRWNNAELQVGGKCLVQMDECTEINSTDESNNNIQNVLNDQNNKNNECVISNINNNNKSIEKSPQLLTGHIQEMSKNQGPVLVFIEELGEKKIVPYASLKPLQEQRKLTSATVASPIFHRKNSSFDHTVVKWRKQWNSNTRKTKDSVNNTVFTSLDGINNNRSNIHTTNDDEKNITNKNTNWAGNSSVKTDSNRLENYTHIENFSTKENYLMDNTVEVRPLSIVLDNPQPLKNTKTDSKEDFRKKSSAKNQNQSDSHEKSVNFNNNYINVNNNNNNNVPIRAENANVVPLPQQSSLSPTSNENVYSQHQNGPPPTMYSSNLNVVCVSPDGNVYAPMTFFGGNPGGISPPSLLPPPSTNVVDRANQVVNLAIQTSVDINGNDLPYTDVPTLRFFFNLGVECFHNNHVWQNHSAPAYVPNFAPQSNNVLPVPALPAPDAPPSNEKSQSLNNPSNNPRSLQPQNRRKNEQTNTFNRSNMYSYGNTKSIRADTRQDSAKNKNESHHPAHDTNKSKSTYSNNENHRDYNNGNWDQRKNNTQGRYRKTNEGRNRNDRSGQYYEHHHRSYGIQQDNNNSNGTNQNSNNFGRNELQTSQKNKFDNGHQIQPMNPPPLLSPVPASSPPFHQHINQPTATMYTNVPYYPNDMEAYYSPNANMYPISYVSHATEAVEGVPNLNTYICTAPDNYPQNMPPIYTPITYPPPPLYSAVPGPNVHENWYAMPNGQAHFVSYSHVPVSQPPPQSAISVGASPPNN